MITKEEPISELTRYSLRGHSSDLEKQAQLQVPILGKLALRGQATTIYAQPNLGKTLITLNLLMNAMDKGAFKPQQLFYINMDDDATGLATKTRMAEEYRFEILSDGQQGFSTTKFFEIVRAMIETGEVNGAILVLDTLKKFVDPMDKRLTRQFGTLVRSFVTLGGTVIALSHTNKRPNSDGSSIHSGTSDIVEDFDCIYIADEIPQEGVKPNKLVVFKNKKRRGAVAERAIYSYANGADLSYDERMASVEEITGSLDWYEPDARSVSEAKVMVAITDCIKTGIDIQKIRLRNAAASSANVSRQIAQRVLDKYTGADPTAHRWTYSVGAHGARAYALIPDAVAGSSEPLPVVNTKDWPNGHDPEF